MAAWTPLEADRAKLRDLGYERESYHLELPEAQIANFKYMTRTVDGSSTSFDMADRVVWS